MRKTGMVISILILVVAFAATMFACSNVVQTVEYEDEIKTRYSDAYEILESFDADSSAIEAKDEKRVKKSICLDTRVKGDHSLGLYAVKGESIVVNIDEKQLENGNVIVINPNLANEQRYTLTQEETTINVSESGIVEFEYNGKDDKSNSTIVVVSGAVEGSYYRYGIDNSSISIKNVGNYTTLDSVNVRLYVPNDYIDSIENPAKVMLWWRSAVDYIDSTLGESFYANDYSPLRIYLTGNSFDYNIDKNAIKVPIDYSTSLVGFDSLISGAEGKILTVLKNIAIEKISKSNVECFKNKMSLFSDVLSTAIYIQMIDSCTANLEIDSNYVLSPYLCMKKLINSEYSTEEEKAVIAYTNLAYTYGNENCLRELGLMANSVDNFTDFIVQMGKVKETNLSDFSAKLEYEITAEQKELMKDGQDFNYVSSSYSFGAFGSENQTGIHFKLGETGELDFNSSIVCSEDEQWTVASIEGDGWNCIDDGIYKYTPNPEILTDTFKINLVNGEKKESLIGRLTVDVAVSSYKLYSNIKYDQLGTDKLTDAIKSVKDVVPTEVKALTTAEVIKEGEVDTTKYSLAVTTGCIEVPIDGKFSFYLISSGLCKVVFGVKDHDFVMFENSLTVGSYTEELRYDISLQTGYKYYYTIYVLSNVGSGYAKLGLKTIPKEDLNGVALAVDDAIVDIDDNYIVYNDKHITRESIVEFNPKTHDLPAFVMQDDIENDLEIGEIREYKILNVEQNKDYLEDLSITGEVEPTNNAVNMFILPLVSSSKVNYMKINVTGMAGVHIKVACREGKSPEFANEIINTVLEEGDNYFEINYDKVISDARVSFYSENKFSVAVNSICFGKVIKEMTIVQSTSTSLEYIGEWYTSHNYNSINNSLLISNSASSSVKLRFNGDYISIYACKDSKFGSATVYIDESEVGIIKLNDSSVKCSQLVFDASVKPGDHVIEIRANGETPINLDYFAVSKLGETVVNNDFSKLWYVVFIPAIIIIGLIVCIVLDIKVKKKREKANQDNAVIPTK